ncbi:M23 family metallopeptidase [Pseudonocardia hispaniensis]|uniref:M23 family metallopeptidase n=1 Tax=Pseudonocardia hispaniensis TaxID=904933 RepID=A0ABW1J2D0_9PSEU
MLRLGVEQSTGAAAADGPVNGAELAALAALPAAAPDSAVAAGLRAAVDPRREAAAAAANATNAVAAVQAAQVAQEAEAAKAAQQAQQTRVAQVGTAGSAQIELAAQVKPAALGGVQVVAGRVSSGFGMRGGAMHSGLDIAAPIGTPIRTPLAGTVISAGPASGFGLWVRVQHADGTITVYGHINRSLVSVGQQVAAGQQIAEVGNRGQSTGPHLHIEVITSGGQKIDPRPWLDSRGFRYQ